MKEKAKIFITRPIPGPCIETLKARYNLTMNKQNRVLSDWQLKRSVRGADVIVSLLTDHIDSQVMEAAGPQLKLIANYAIGFDNVDLHEANKRNIIVTNTPGGLTESIAEHTCTLIFALARRIVEADSFVRAHRYHQWEPELMLGQQLQGKTLGIVGLGRIGLNVATITRAMGMSVIYHDVHRNKVLEKKHRLDYMSLNELLAKADVVSLHVPLLPSTKHLISHRELALMKNTALLINTARGPVVDERALTEALQKKKIWGAALDVFEHEPTVSRQLEKLSNVIFTPHIASATIEARNEMSKIVANNITAFLETGKALNPAT